MTFSDDQIDRYARQLLLDEIGGRGQSALLGARVLLVGAGGLGSPAALYLAAAGVGHLTLIDPDTVELSNLQRQVLHRTEDLGRPKVARGAEALVQLDPELEVHAIHGALGPDNAPALFAEHDVVLDGSDDFDIRFLCNDIALETGTPLVHGAVLGFGGQVTVVRPAADHGCYRCLFEAPPPRGEVPPCSEAGVLGSVCGVVGSVMATEAVKLLVGAGDSLAGRLWIWDGLAARSREVALPKNPECTACGTGQARLEQTA